MTELLWCQIEEQLRQQLSVSVTEYLNNQLLVFLCPLTWFDWYDLIFVHKWFVCYRISNQAVSFSKKNWNKLYLYFS